MPSDEKNPPVGHMACLDCGAEVVTRLNKNFRAYYFCHCGSHHRFPTKTSHEMKAAAARGATREESIAHVAQDLPPAGPGHVGQSGTGGERKRFRLGGRGG